MIGLAKRFFNIYPIKDPISIGQIWEHKVDGCRLLIDQVDLPNKVKFTLLRGTEGLEHPTGSTGEWIIGSNPGETTLEKFLDLWRLIYTPGIEDWIELL